MPRRTRHRRHVVIVPVLLAATMAASCVTARESSPVQPSGSASPSIPASASPSATPLPTPPAPGEPWGGLAWSEAVPVVLPWEGEPEALVEWRGGGLAIGWHNLGGDSREQVVAVASDWVAWSVIARGADLPFRGGIDQLLVAESGLVAITRGEGYLCQLPRPGACVGIGVYTSPDGVTWTEIADSSPFHGGGLTAAARGPGGLIAVGEVGWGKPAMWASDDGATWQRLSLAPSLAKARPYGIAATESGWILTGAIGWLAVSQITGEVQGMQTAAAWWSAEGRVWTDAAVEQPPEGAAEGLGTVYSAGHGLLAQGWVGGAPGTGGDMAALGAWSSVDGRAWRLSSSESSDPSDGPGSPTGQLIGDGQRVVSVRAFAKPDVDSWDFEVWESLDGAAWHSLGEVDGEVAAGTWLLDREGVKAVGYSGAAGDAFIWFARAVP